MKLLRHLVTLSPYHLVTAAFGGALLLATGCARSPAGGPSTPNAPNRLTVRLRVAQPINDLFYYDFAFDDDDDLANGTISDGPVAIVGPPADPTTLNNGVVIGSFTVLVEYHQGQFHVYRRRLEPGPGGGVIERLDLATQAFITPPAQPVRGDTFQFTLNLDAMTDSGDRLFQDNTQRLDVNFVTSSEAQRLTTDLRRKPFDSLGNGPFSTFLPDFDIRLTQSISGSDPSGDVFNDGSLNDSVQRGKIDILSYTLSVERQR